MRAVIQANCKAFVGISKYWYVPVCTGMYAYKYLLCADYASMQWRLIGNGKWI